MAAHAHDVVWKSRFDEYRHLRERAGVERRRSALPAHVLDMIRSDVGDRFAPEIGSPSVEAASYSRERVEAKIFDLVHLLGDSYSEFVSPAELAATELFLDTAFSHYDGTCELPVDPDGRPTFAFLVHMRLSSDTVAYGDELVPLVPAMHYVPPELRALMMMGVPPYIADTYRSNGALGHLIVSPVFADIATGVPRSTFIRSSRPIVQDAVDFAERLGARFIGLGGLLPSLTRYGQAVEPTRSIITTGHAGTISLVLSNVERATQRWAGSAIDAAGPTIGVLGLGSIGRSIASAVLSYFGDRCPVIVYDHDPAAADGFRSSLDSFAAGRLTVVPSTGALIARSDIVVSAVTTMVDLDAELEGSLVGKLPLSGKVFIDDSQPYSFAPDRVAQLGGEVTWVVARTDGRIRRRWYDYATMADAQCDFFGCEAEVAALAAEFGDLVASGSSEQAAFEVVGELAVSRAAALADVAAIAKLFDKHGIVVAPPQTFGANRGPEIIDLRDGRSERAANRVDAGIRDRRSDDGERVSSRRP